MHFHALSDRSISHFSRINSEIRNSKLSFRWHELFYYSTRIVPFHFHLFIYLLIFQYFLIALRNENNQNPKRSFRSHNRHYFYTNRMEIVDEKGGKKKKRKNERIISKVSIGPPTSNSDYLTSDRNDTKGYEHFNSYLGHIVLFNYKPEFFIGRVARENYENYKYLFSDR